MWPPIPVILATDCYHRMGVIHEPAIQVVGVVSPSCVVSKQLTVFLHVVVSILLSCTVYALNSSINNNARQLIVCAMIAKVFLSDTSGLSTMQDDYSKIIFKLGNSP